MKIQLIAPKSKHNNSAQIKDSKLIGVSSPSTRSTDNSNKDDQNLKSHMIVVQKSRLPEPPANFVINSESDNEIENTEVNELRKQLQDFF